MVEEVLALGQQIVADPEVLEQSFRREFDYAVGGVGYVADLGRVVDPAQIGWMSLAHQACNDIACNSSHGFAGRIFASGKVRWTH